MNHDLNLPVCPECHTDLEFTAVEDVDYDGERMSFDVWRCKDCHDDKGLQVDYHYPQGMFGMNRAV